MLGTASFPSVAEGLPSPAMGDYLPSSRIRRYSLGCRNVVITPDTSSENNAHFASLPGCGQLVGFCCLCQR